MSISRKFLQPCLNNIRVGIRARHAESVKSKVEYYQVLEIPPNATVTEVREAYFRKVKTCHPDINPSDEAKKQFASIQEAYKTLSDRDKRIGYDYDRSRTVTSKKDGIEVPPETEEEKQARVAKKVEDQEVYYTAKKEVSSSTKTWGAMDEWGSGARSIKLNKIENRMTLAEKEAIFKASSAYKFDEKMLPHVTKVKEVLNEKWIKGGPKDDTPDQEAIADTKKHLKKYGAVMLLMLLVYTWEKLTRYGVFQRGASHLW